MIAFTVKSDERYSILPLIKNIYILNNPTAYFISSSICENATTYFIDFSYTVNGNNIINWRWNLGDGGPALTTKTASSIYNN